MSTQSNTSRFFNTIDNVDRHLYGRKMKNFIQGSILVLIAAPILDWFLEVPHDRLTFYSTLVFFGYVTIIFLAWISAWRDDAGSWTWQRAKSRLLMYYEVLKDTAAETKTTSKDEFLYKAGWILFFGSIGWKACQNLSVFIRKPMEAVLHTRIVRLRKFEYFTNHWYWVVLLIGVGIMSYLYRTNPQILQRIKKDLRQLFTSKKFHAGSMDGELIKIDAEKLIVNSKQADHIDAIKTANTDSLFNGFVSAMNKWTPGTSLHYEYQFQDALYRHLKKNMPNSSVELEYPIGEKALGNKGRADIVIDETILIEMKRDSSAGAVQRAKGQILQYSDIWRNRGPVVLLLCKYDFDHAKVSFSSTMVDLKKLDRPVLTMVAAN
jgi:hypothetical protein